MASDTSSWRAIYILVLLGCIIAITTVMLLGLPNPPNTVALAGYESRLIVPNTALYGSILLSDPQGGVNTFILSKKPSTYYTEAKLEQQLMLPKGHYKFWARHLNAGSLVKVKFQWSPNLPLSLCILYQSIEAFLDGRIQCLVAMESKEGFALEFQPSKSGDHFFVLESLPLPRSSYSSQNSNIKPYLQNYRLPLQVEETGNDVVEKQISKPQQKPTVAGGGFVSHTNEEESWMIQQIVGDMGRRLQSMEESDEANTKAAPEFWVAYGNVSFDMQLLQYQTSDADDLYIGSFSKDFAVNVDEWLVIYNPADSNIFKVTISLSRRIREFMTGVILLELLIVLCISYTCWSRYNHLTVVPDDEQGISRRMSISHSLNSKSRHRGEERSKNIDERDRDSESPSYTNSPTQRKLSSNSTNTATIQRSTSHSGHS